MEEVVSTFKALHQAVWLSGEPVKTAERIEARRAEILKRASEYGQPVSEVRRE